MKNLNFSIRVKRNARPDLLEQIEALGFELEPIVFSSQALFTLLEALHWHHNTFVYKERVNSYGKEATCLPGDHPTLAGLSPGKLYHRAKKFDGKVGFSKAVRYQIKVYPSWHSVYHSNISSLLILYYCMYDHLHVTQIWQVPSYYPWPSWAWG